MNKLEVPDLNLHPLPLLSPFSCKEEEGSEEPPRERIRVGSFTGKEEGESLIGDAYHECEILVTNNSPADDETYHLLSTPNEITCVTVECCGVSDTLFM